jgi:hypothetical protein
MHRVYTFTISPNLSRAKSHGEPRRTTRGGLAYMQLRLCISVNAFTSGLCAHGSTRLTMTPWLCQYIYNTIFTIRPFTTITFLGLPPSRYFCTSALANTKGSTSAASRLSEILRFILVLPFIEIG